MDRLIVAAEVVEAEKQRGVAGIARQYLAQEIDVPAPKTLRHVVIAHRAARRRGGGKIPQHGFLSVGSAGGERRAPAGGGPLPGGNGDGAVVRQSHRTATGSPVYRGPPGRVASRPKKRGCDDEGETRSAAWLFLWNGCGAVGMHRQRRKFHPCSGGGFSMSCLLLGLLALSGVKPRRQQDAGGPGYLLGGIVAAERSDPAARTTTLSAGVPGGAESPARMKRLPLLLALAWFGPAFAQAPPAALGPLQALVSIAAPTMHDVGLAGACGFIHPGTVGQMRGYLGARVRRIGGKIAGAGPASFAAASRGPEQSFRGRNGRAQSGRLHCPCHQRRPDARAVRPTQPPAPATAGRTRAETQRLDDLTQPARSPRLGQVGLT